MADKNLSADSDPLVLARALLSAADGRSWLAEESGRILVDSAGQEIANLLPVLKGPRVQVDLTELVRGAAQGKGVELTGLELDGFGRENGNLARVRVAPLDLPADWPQVFWVHVTAYAPSEDLAIQGVKDEKFRSMTGLAAKIAHELNNPLDGSLRYINLALRQLQHDGEVLQSPSKVTEYLSSAREALGKINEILSDLVRFARHGQANVEKISINDLVEQTIRTLAARAQAAGVSIVTTLSEDLPAAGGTRMYQVFCNLLKNAIDAVAERRKREPDCSALVTISTRAQGRAVRIVFEDTGVGLPAERNFLFDPFFTTKPAGEGTGLGLAISREIVRSYGGTIMAEDGVKGARFVIELPEGEEEGKVKMQSAKCTSQNGSQEGEVGQ